MKRAKELLACAVVFLLAMETAGCTQIQAWISSKPIATALATKDGQLFCGIVTKGGAQLIVTLIDGAASQTGAAAPLVVMAAGATSAAVQADCQAAATATGAAGGVPVAQAAVTAPPVAIVAPPGTVTASP